MHYSAVCVQCLTRRLAHGVGSQFVQMELTGIRAGLGGRGHGTIPHTGVLPGHSALADELR